jgi:hypothetical protein
VSARAFLMNVLVVSAIMAVAALIETVVPMNSNYGNVLTVYDRMLGTFTSADRAESVVYGLDEADPTRIASFGGLLSMPFQREGRHSLTQKSGSGRAYIDNIST